MRVVYSGEGGLKVSVSSSTVRLHNVNRSFDVPRGQLLAVLVAMALGLPPNQLPMFEGLLRMMDDVLD